MLVSSKTSRNFVAMSPSSQLIINLIKLRNHSHTQVFIWCFSGPKNCFAFSIWWSTEIRSFAFDCSFDIHPVKYRKSKSLYNFPWFIATMHAIYVRVCWNSSRDNESGGGQGGGSPGEQGAGEGGKRENRGREAVSTWGRKAGAEINKAIVYCFLLGIIQSKALIYLDSLTLRCLLNCETDHEQWLKAIVRTDESMLSNSLKKSSCFEIATCCPFRQQPSDTAPQIFALVIPF